MKFLVTSCLGIALLLPSLARAEDAPPAPATPAVTAPELTAPVAPAAVPEAVAPVEAPAPAPAPAPEPAPVVAAPAPAAKPVNTAAKITYVAQHVLLGACTAALGVTLVGVLVSGGLMLAVPRNGLDTTVDKTSAKAWRTSLGVLLLGGVLPGLLLGTAGGVAVTAISAFRDRAAILQ